ncbi:hypothetical protein RYX36_000138 [Vicia faba]
MPSVELLPSISLIGCIRFLDGLLVQSRYSSPNDQPAAAYVLLARQDLAMSTLARKCKYKEVETPTNVNVISMFTPYMLNLHPVTISSTISDAIGLEGTKLEDTDSVDGSLLDGMEHIFDSSTQLRYGRDLRLNEVRRLLYPSRPVAIQTSVKHSASDQDLQQTQLWHLAQRTTFTTTGHNTDFTTTGDLRSQPYTSLNFFLLHTVTNHPSSSSNFILFVNNTQIRFISITVVQRYYPSPSKPKTN